MCKFFYHSVRNLYDRQVLLSGALKEYLEEAERTENHVRDWIRTIDQVNNNLKEVGDMAHWSKHIKSEIDDVVNKMKSMIVNKISDDVTGNQ